MMNPIFEIAMNSPNILPSRSGGAMSAKYARPRVCVCLKIPTKEAAFNSRFHQTPLKKALERPASSPPPPPKNELEAEV